MKFILFLLRVMFTVLFACLLCTLTLLSFNSIFTATSFIIPYAFYPFDICLKAPVAWKYIKIVYLISSAWVCFLISNTIYCFIFKDKICISKKKKNLSSINSSLNLYLGKDSKTNYPVFLTEKALYQNMLITGTIGSGKTSSSMYPFTKQLIGYNAANDTQKLGMLILDVKGNYYKQVQKYAEEFNRLDDICVIELGGNIKYNPLDKPDLKPSILANRLKTVLTLFSQNNSESYWLDKAEQVLCECIKLCRLYNNNYVTFEEIHKLVNSPNYYNEKLDVLRNLFKSGKLTKSQVYDLHAALTFFETEFKALDSRVLSILKSEITRMTNTFISDYDVLNTFSPKKENINFIGFKDVIKNGKIVVLNMNIANYKNLSKLIAAYLKLDFQAEVLSQLSTNNIRPSVFISDEFHEYVTTTDADFFAQSREAKCINIVATQSYTSLLNTIKDEYAVKAIVQNLINKLWYRTDDSYTIEDAQKQIGREDKTKILRTISENAQETNYNYLTNSLNSKNSNVSESIATQINTDFIYDTNFFTQKLETFSCLSFLSDGTRILPPSKLKMETYFGEISNKKRKSYFKII